MNIALLSNSLVNRTLTFCLDYVLNEQVGYILFPEENHNVDEILCFDGRKNIIICNSVDDAICKSDVIIASNESVINRSTQSKRTILVTNPWAKEIENIPENEFFKGVNTKPTIAVVSLGKFTDQYYTEILLNKILFEMGAKIYQVYSKETMNILSELSKQEILNKDVFGCEEDEADVAVIAIDGTKYHNDAEFVCELTRISPDILFVCIDRTIKDIDHIENIIRIVRQVNLIIRSPYISYDVGTGVEYPVYCGLANDDFSINSLDQNLEARMREQIVKFLYFPKETVIF